jgi:hypothetical protein
MIDECPSGSGAKGNRTIRLMVLKGEERKRVMDDGWWIDKWGNRGERCVEPFDMCGWPPGFITRQHHNRGEQRGLQYRNTTLHAIVQRHPTRRHHSKVYLCCCLRTLRKSTTCQRPQWLPIRRIIYLALCCASRSSVSDSLGRHLVTSYTTLHCISQQRYTYRNAITI